VRKKLVPVLVITLILALTTVSSAGFFSNLFGGKKKDDKKVVEFWTMQLKPTFTDYINGVISDFEAENPNVKVKWVDVPWGDMEKKVLSSTAAGNAPDIVNLNPPFSMKLAELGALVDMEEYVPQETKDKYFLRIWKTNQYQEETFAVPWYLSTSITMYNAQIFEQAGLNPANPPQKYSQLLEMGRKIKEETGKYIMLPPIAETGRYMEYMVRQGIPLFNEDKTKAVFNTEKSVEFLKMWTKMYQKGLIPESTITEGHGKAVDLYQSGQAAILLTGPQFLKRIEQNAPQIYKQTRVTPEITGEANKVNVAVMNIAVTKQSKHPKAAVKFATFMTNDQNQLEFSKQATILPSTKEAAQAPYFMESEKTVRDRARKISAQQLDRAEKLIAPMENQNQINQIIDTMVQQALLGDRSPEAAIENAVKECNKILATNK